MGDAQLVAIGEDEVIPLTISPSQLLFGVDREAYKLAMNLTASIVPQDAAEVDEEARGIG